MKLILSFLAATGLMMTSQGIPEDPVAIFKKGNNRFSALMLPEVVKQRLGHSGVLSGFSGQISLAQLALAAEGDTHTELLNAIGMPDDEKLKAAFSQVGKIIQAVEGVDLKTASRIYVADKYELNSKFQSESLEVFGSDVQNVDFTQNVEAAAAINAWVESNTNKRITHLVDPDSLNADTRVVLVNSIYFKGLWEHPFSPLNTKDEDFFVRNLEVFKVPTMSQQKRFEYGASKELNAKLLRMYYGKMQSSMLIVVPNEIEGLPALEEKLKDPEVLNRAIKEMHNTEVEVHLPKFTIETTTNLKKVLEHLNVTKIFGNKAQLTKLLNSNKQLYVSEAVQKAFIEVSEEGAEAAAVNKKLEAAPAVVFRANRPFFFSIAAQDFTLLTGAFTSDRYFS